MDQAWAAVVAAGEEAAREVLRGRGYSDGDIATIEADLVDPRRNASSSTEALIACIQTGAAALAAQLGRDSTVMLADLSASLGAYSDSVGAGEIAAAATLNALPEVTSRLEAAGNVTVTTDQLDIGVTLPPDGVTLLRLRRR